MRQVTIYTTNKEYKHFLELAKNLNYVKKIETDDIDNTKKEIFANIRQGAKEAKLISDGKLNGTELKDFLDELKTASYFK